jgi:hypothetical protein
MRTATWTVLSIAAFAASLPATLVLLGPIGFAVGAGGQLDTHLVEMALWPILWGGLSVAGSWVAARRFLPAPRPAGAGLALAIPGFVIAAASHVVLQQWETGRFGYPDPDLVGPMAGLFAVLVMIGVAAFGTFVAPANAGAVPAGIAIIGAGLVGLIAVSNAAGLDDGIAPDSVPLAAWTLASVAYAGVAAVLVIRRVSGWGAPDHSSRGCRASAGRAGTR